MSPKLALVRITTLKRVWGTLRPGSSFYGKTFEQFCAEVQPSLDARAELDTIDEHRAATAVRRDEAAMRPPPRAPNRARGRRAPFLTRRLLPTLRLCDPPAHELRHIAQSILRVRFS
jgi:hypothetical protein